jgi:hypothetical protein
MVVVSSPRSAAPSQTNVRQIILGHGVKHRILELEIRRPMVGI